jgi:isoleucyl-tRNA synthetase
VIAPLEEDGTYIVGGGFGPLEGKFAGDVPDEVFASLAEKGLLYRIQDYTHSYPHCWRCGSELVFRLVDEWFISMDGPLSDGSSRTLRDAITEVSDKVTWIPDFGKARERDWLRNMHDWMISKKRYYGLALPIFECKACGNFEVIGSEIELKQRAVEGWDQFEGHSPHRPYVDHVKIACSSCGAPVERITDVGNPWLDAGIVPFSTLDYGHNPEYWRRWFPPTGSRRASRGSSATGSMPCWLWARSWSSTLRTRARRPSSASFPTPCCVTSTARRCTSPRATPSGSKTPPSA